MDGRFGEDNERSEKNTPSASAAPSAASSTVPSAAVLPFLPRQSPPLQGTESAAGAIARVKYSHDAMIDLIIAVPGITQGRIAEHFGYTGPWVSRIFNSDAFQARLAQRKSDIVDPSLVASIDERLRTVASKSLEVILGKLETAPTLDAAFRGAELATKALGYGARGPAVAVQQNFVVAMPGKAASAAEWAAAHRSRPAATTIDLADITGGGSSGDPAKVE